MEDPPGRGDLAEVAVRRRGAEEPRRLQLRAPRQGRDRLHRVHVCVGVEALRRADCRERKGRGADVRDMADSREDLHPDAQGRLCRKEGRAQGLF